MRSLLVFLTALVFVVSCGSPAPSTSSPSHGVHGSVRQTAYVPVNLATQVTGILPAANGGLGSLFFLYSEAAAVNPGTGTSGNFSVGPKFYLEQAATCTGVKWYATHAATFKVSIWNTAGTRLTSESVVVGSAGAQSTTFTSPQSLSANSNSAYTISIWDSTGIAGKYINSNSINNLIPALNASVQWGPHIRWAGFYFHAGDAFPDTGAGSEIYPFDPLFQ